MPVILALSASGESAWSRAAPLAGVLLLWKATPWCLPGDGGNAANTGPRAPLSRWVWNAFCTDLGGFYARPFDAFAECGSCEPFTPR